MEHEHFSVLVPIYYQTEPEHLDQALKSVFGQSETPSEVILVVDRSQPAPELNALIESWYTNRDEISIESIDVDHSLGHALQRGVKRSSNELIFRMDADDICKPTRFESQLSVLREDSSIDVLGSYIEEFDSNPDEPHDIKTVPTTPSKVTKISRYRCPINHPSVAYKKSSVLSAGGYRDIGMVEDYDLWMRMLDNGCKIANIPEVLVSVRADTDLYARRGGIDYLKSEIELQKRLYQRGQINFLHLLINIVVRIPIRLAPNWLRKIVYRTILRS